MLFFSRFRGRILRLLEREVACTRRKTFCLINKKHVLDKEVIYSKNFVISAHTPPPRPRVQKLFLLVLFHWALRVTMRAHGNANSITLCRTHRTADKASLFYIIAQHVSQTLQFTFRSANGSVVSLTLSQSWLNNVYSKLTRKHNFMRRFRDHIK